MPLPQSATVPKTFSFFLLGLSFFLLGTGCSLGPKFIVQDYHPPAKTAVLPFANETNDVTGPESLRNLLIEMLPSRGYVPLAKDAVDQTLLEKFGITDGGQLGSVSPQELGKNLQVDALFYGTLIQFVDFPFGFGRKRTVKANLKLVETKTGKLLWEDEKSWTNPELHLSVEEAKRAAVRQVAERQIGKMTGTFLQQESMMMLSRALRNLPLAR